MYMSPATSSLLASLDAMSAGTLARRADLGVLLELGAPSGRQQQLRDLSFFAKFVDRTYRIMKRIGKEGEGYETLTRELGGNLEKATALIRDLVEDAPPDEKSRFLSGYCAVTGEGLENLLALLHDLGWYKNWLIDTGKSRKGVA